MRAFYADGGRSGMYGKKATAETRARQSASLKASRARKAAAVNHVVISVESAGREDVYDMTVPGAESFIANGVVVHNCLSFAHEHTRTEVVVRIDPGAAEAYFLRYDGWDAETVRQQVLTVTPDALLTALPTDVRSVMCYGLPAEIMRDGIAVPGGTRINDEDAALAAKVYPKGTGGGGGGGKPAGFRAFGLTFGQDVPQGRPVRIPAFAAPREIPHGKYSVVADAPEHGQGEGAAEATAHP
jgi:hypothetical protein